MRARVRRIVLAAALMGGAGVQAQTPPAQTPPVQTPALAPVQRPAAPPITAVPPATAPAAPRAAAPAATPPRTAAPRAAPPNAVNVRRPRTFAQCNQEALRRAMRGAERRHWVARCQLGYGRPLFRRRGPAVSQPPASSDARSGVQDGGESGSP